MLNDKPCILWKQPDSLMNICVYSSAISIIIWLPVLDGGQLRVTEVSALEELRLQIKRITLKKIVQIIFFCVLECWQLLWIVRQIRIWIYCLLCLFSNVTTPNKLLHIWWMGTELSGLVLLRETDVVT